MAIVLWLELYALPHFLEQFLGKVNLLLEAVDFLTGQRLSKSIVEQVLLDSFRRLIVDGPDSQEVLFELLSLPFSNA